MIPSRHLARHLARGTILVRPISTIALARSSLLGHRGLALPSLPTLLEGKRFYAARKAKAEQPKATKQSKTDELAPVQTNGQRQLQEALELRYRLSKRKSRKSLAGIIAQYPDIRAALDVVNDPQYVIRLPWPQMCHYITAKRRGGQVFEPSPPFPAPDSLAELFKSIGIDDLPVPQVKELLYAYVVREHIDLDGLEGSMLKELMHRRLLDGIGPKVLSLVPPVSDEPATEGAEGDTPLKKTRLNDPKVRATTPKRAAEHNWGFPTGWSGKRAYSTTRTVYPNPQVIQQLQDIRELKTRVDNLNKTEEKHEILRDYPQLRELLEMISAEGFRTNLSFASFEKHVEKYKLQGGKHSALPPPCTIIEMLGMLSRRAVTGTEAKAMVASFLDNHDVTRTDGSLVKIFGTLLDRKTLMGVSAGVLRSMTWDDATDAPSGWSTDLARFPVALGKSIEGDPLSALNSKTGWYASRKLDGVRCITTMDIFVPSDARRSLSLVDLSLESRTGKAYDSLANLRPQLEKLVKFPKLRHYLGTDTFVVEQRDDGAVKRLVLDGECCVMVPVSSRKPSDRAASVLTSETSEEGHTSAAAELWKDDGLIEDFAATQSQVARKNEVVQHPRYFLFDLVPGGEFIVSGATTIFSDRNARLREMIDWLEVHLIKEKVEERMIKRMVQIKVDLEDLDGMYARSVEEGWEGLIFRADKPYKGSRSTDIRKYKEMQEDEYKVKAVVPTRMRLPINGEYAERLAAASVTIDHRGTDVQVGSGMTPEDRVRWAEDPSSIIGKTITVKYFGETSNQDRPGQMSLRHPVIKAVFDNGRDM